MLKFTQLRDGRIWVGAPVLLAHEPLCSCSHGSCDPSCQAVGGLCPPGGAVTCLRLRGPTRPSAGFSGRLGGVLLHLIPPSTAPQSPPQVLERPPGWMRSTCQDPQRQSRVLGSRCLGAYFSKLGKMYRQMEGPSQHSSGAQTSHFLAARPSRTLGPVRGKWGS